PMPWLDAEAASLGDSGTVNVEFNFIFVLMIGLAGTLALGAGARRADAEVLMTEKAALERAFPGRAPGRRVLYLAEGQGGAGQKAARSKRPAAVVTVFEDRSAEGSLGRALLDTHVVRTMPETVMTVVGP